MASTDSRPVPIKNTAFRAVFPIMDADGDLVPAATGLDSEVSKDQGTFADCTSEATEIATASGIYYLDLTATEMNADCVTIQVKTTSSGAKTTVLVFYPEETGDINVDVMGWNGAALATPNSSGHPVVTVKSGTGTGEVSVTSGVVASNMTQIAGNTEAATRLGTSARTTTTGTVDTTVAPTTTMFEAADITEATPDHYKNALVRWHPSSALYGSQALVEAYALVGGRGRFTVSAMPDAPTAGNIFVLV